MGPAAEASHPTSRYALLLAARILLASHAEKRHAWVGCALKEPTEICQLALPPGCN